MIIFLQALNILNVALGVLFHLLLLRTFGVSVETDTFFLATAIVQFGSSFLTGFLLDLYVPMYHEIKAQSETNAQQFSGAVFILALGLSILLLLLILLAAPLLVSLFASGFSEEKMLAAEHTLRILSLSVPFTVATLVLNSTLNAHLIMAVTYWTNLLPPLFGMAAVVLISSTYGLDGVLAALVVASAVAFAGVLLYYRKQFGWHWANPLHVPAVRSLLRQNIPVRVGTLVYSLRGPLTTNMLSFFPTGSLTLYQYADKILTTLFSVANAPILQILYMKASTLLPQSKLEELKGVLKATVRSNIALTVALLIPTVTLFQPVFGALLHQRITPEELSTMFVLFLALVPFYLTLAFEMPFVNITLALKRGNQVLRIGTTFVLLYGLFLYAGVGELGIYAIPVALFLAQLQNAVSYARFVGRKIPVFDREMQIILGRFLVLIAALLVLNLWLQSDRVLSLYANLLIAGMWAVVAGNETVASFRFITTRGEIR
ncbi:MAG TPA: lipid II flippase MurJ [Bacteroidota bacterium]|nr:lipid II flippase MurJ [Bacteroidota bacterium]